jgi:hypothetical protein
MLKVKVKLSLYRPWGFQEVDARRVSRQSAHEGGRRTYNVGLIFSVYILI